MIVGSRKQTNHKPLNHVVQRHGDLGCVESPRKVDYAPESEGGSKAIKPLFEEYPDWFANFAGLKQERAAEHNKKWNAGQCKRFVDG
jgi:hypothetical protein